MEYDFSGLTRAQQWLLTLQGWDEESDTGAKPQKRTVEPMVARGLIVLQPKRAGGTDPRAYIVPHAVHIAWCEYCSSRTKRYARA